jgi:flagellar biosynthesis protein FlhF
MNVRRFTARTSRDALVLVRQALGEDAVVLSTKPSAEGVEVLAMAPEGMKQIERMAAKAPVHAQPQQQNNQASNPVEDDVAQLSMSTLSFQDYVRERMLRRRKAAMQPQAAEAAAPATRAATHAPAHAPAASAAHMSPDRSSVLEQRMSAPASAPVLREPVHSTPLVHTAHAIHTMHDIRVPALADVQHDMHESYASQATHASYEANTALAVHSAAASVASANASAAASARRDQEDMMSELRSMKGLIEERFGALAFMEKLNRQPGQARLTQKLLDCGFSPALIRKIGDSLPMDVVDESAWMAGVLERNLVTAEAEAPLEDQGGVYALVGATGVGKTTTTAKLAAAFATKYGASNLGLITLDAYRIGAHEQLRAYGRILGVPVHTAHDRASLEDLLELLAGKKMVLIDTAGMAQRDARTRELLEMVSHRNVRKLLVINAASQGETIEDVMMSYQASTCAGIVLSKMDEAVKLGPALDALIRMKLKVIGVANGQRVPEDWHRLSANALVHRALRGGGSAAYKLDASDVSLIFAAPQAPRPSQGVRAAPNA